MRLILVLRNDKSGLFKEEGDININNKKDDPIDNETEFFEIIECIKNDADFNYLFFLDNVEDNLCEKDKDGSVTLSDFINKMKGNGNEEVNENIKVLVTYRNSKEIDINQENEEIITI